MTSLAEDHVGVHIALRHVVPRLVDEYSERCTRDQAVAAVKAAQYAFAGARVEVFLPILVERIAREELERYSRAERSELLVGPGSCGNRPVGPVRARGVEVGSS